MRIRSSSVINHPLDRVWRAYRNELPSIAQTIPDIREVKEIERTDRENGVEVHCLWVSSAALPPLVDRVIKPEHLQWDDFGTWNDEEHHVDWRIKTKVFTERISCGGRNVFESAGEGKTRLTINGELNIDFDRLPGMPRMISKRVGPRLEKFFVSMITPNLERVTEHLTRYLDRQEAG